MLTPNYQFEPPNSKTRKVLYVKLKPLECPP
jgi:hypothetical protein